MDFKPGKEISHYRLIEKIGEGGMGVVWKAEDTILQRTVAIKVLPADASLDDERRKMFLNEARLASSLSDPHIAHVYELGRADDLDFIAMEYIDGKPLSKIIHGRPLPQDKVVSLGLQISKALSKAHHKGLLHRDLKPSNILVTSDGDARLVDFGLATLFEPRLTSTALDEATQTAASLEEVLEEDIKKPALVGTLPYMSPEQLKSKQIDQRSDIFSLGVVLYEMTTGFRPFQGATTTELIAEILKGHPAPAHDFVPKTPIELDRIIQKALALKRDDRYQTTDDLTIDLKRLEKDLESGSSPSWQSVQEALKPIRKRKLITIASVVAALVMVAVAAWWYYPRFMASSTKHTVLILPFAVQGQEEGAKYAGKAFAEALAINLLQDDKMRVLPIPESDNTGPVSSDNQIKKARNLGADIVLYGTIQREAKSIHGTMNVINSKNNTLLWVCKKEITQGELPELASAFIAEIMPKLGIKEEKKYFLPTELISLPEAQRSPQFVEAIEAVNLHLPSALSITEQLIQQYPDNLYAHYLRLIILVDEYRQKPVPENRRAVENIMLQMDHIDPNNPYSSDQRGFLLNHENKRNEAIKLFTDILNRRDLSPRYKARIYRLRGMSTTAIDPQKALSDIDEALRLDPASGGNYVNKAHTLLYLNKPEEAEQYAKLGIYLCPNEPYAYETLALIYSMMKKWELAIPNSQKACELSSSQETCIIYAIHLLQGAHHEEALEAEKVASKLTESIYGTYNLACFWALERDIDKALHYLRRSVDLGYTSEYMMRDPDFNFLHGNPKFEALVAEVKKRIGPD